MCELCLGWGRRPRPWFDSFGSARDAPDRRQHRAVALAAKEAKTIVDMTDRDDCSPSAKADGTTIRIRPAREADLVAARSLLVASALPTAGLEDQFGSQYAVAATPSGDMVGLAGFEVYTEYGLLRSVAVSSGWRGRGVGRLLVGDRAAAAKSRGLAALYALTTTAPGFFAGLGFSVADRDDVPAAVRASPEFSSICPDTAVVLCLGLR